MVVTGRIPRERGVQIDMMDVLIDAGAKPGSGKGAMAHGNIDAANHLIERGGKLTLSVAVGLRRDKDIDILFQSATQEEKETAIALASFYAMTDMVSLLLEKGISPNGYPDNEGFHSHATPLHQAVYSGSLETVKLLVEAGADLNATDKAYQGTPLGWSMYMQTEDETSDEMRGKYKLIEAYLKSL